jgi:hypothetical protein
MIWLLFALIQIVSAVLTVIGYPIIGLLAVFKVWDVRADCRNHWPPWAWIWDNEEDGVFGPGTPRTRWQAFYWSALRNPVNNLRFVPGVSKIGRPLLYKTWEWRGKEFYYKVGWMSDGYPALSAGAGKGF